MDISPWAVPIEWTFAVRGKFNGVWLTGKMHLNPSNRLLVSSMDSTQVLDKSSGTIQYLNMPPDTYDIIWLPDSQGQNIFSLGVF